MVAGSLLCRVGTALAAAAALTAGAPAAALYTCSADTNGDAMVDVIEALIEATGVEKFYDDD